jgi:F-type H+-transporting ATPase subunit epsilon
MSVFQLVIETPEATAFTEDVESLVLPGVRGRYGVLAGHAPMAGAVATGVLALRQAGQERWFAVGPGLAEIGPRRVRLLVAAVMPAVHELDASDRAEAYAREAAEPPRVSVEGLG